MIYFSYRRNTGITLAQLIVSSLRARNLEVFLDVDTIHNGKWTEQIEANLRACSDFILLIADDKDLVFGNPENDWYYKEIDTALKLDKNIVIVAVKSVDLYRTLPEPIAAVTDYEVIWYDPLYFEAVIKKISMFLLGSADPRDERVQNKYDTVRNEAQKRLSAQHLLFREANDLVYDQILAGRKSFSVLDIGCNSGEFAELHFLGRDGCSNVIGVDSSEKIFRCLIKNPNFHPFLLDCEADDFVDSLREIMAQFQIDGFDLINMSFLLLHLKDPAALLYKVRELLAPYGYLFIRDLDDSQISAYPDEEKVISRLTKINDYCLHTGNRRTAGSLYTELVNCGYNNISLISESFSTAGATKAQRKRLFYVNYSYIPENVLDMIELNPSVERYKEDYKWISSNINAIERMFGYKQFFYKMGVFAFTAQYTDD